MWQMLVPLNGLLISLQENQTCLGEAAKQALEETMPRYLALKQINNNVVEEW